MHNASIASKAAITSAIDCGNGVAAASNRGLPVIVDQPRDRASRSLRVLVTRLSTEPSRKGWRQASRKEKVS